jgi:uncharacterized Zn finger protein
MVYKMNRNREYSILSKELNLQCPLCKGYSQAIRSIVMDEAVVSCKNCGNIWSKEL